MIRARLEYDPQGVFYDFLAGELKLQEDVIIKNKPCFCDYSPPTSLTELFPELEQLQPNFDYLEDKIPDTEFEELFKSLLHAATTLDSTQNHTESSVIVESVRTSNTEKEAIISNEEFEGSENESLDEPKKNKRRRQNEHFASTLHAINSIAEPRQILKSSSSASSSGAELLREIKSKAKIKNRPWSQSVSTFVNDNHPIIMQKMHNKKRTLGQSI